MLTQLDMNSIEISEKQTKQHVRYKRNMNTREDLKDENTMITYMDRAVYLYMRKYMDKASFKTFVSAERIAQEFGVTRPTVTKSINKLLAKGHITREKKGRGYEYEFRDKSLSDNFEMISFDLLNEKSIPPKVKAFTISMQEFMKDKETGIGKCDYDPIGFSRKLGVSTNTFKKYVLECKKNGIITNDFGDISDLKDQQLQFDLDKLHQMILFVNNKLDLHIQNSNTQINTIQNQVNFIADAVSGIMQISIQNGVQPEELQNAISSATNARLLQEKP